MDRVFRCPACDLPNFVTELRLFRANDEPLHCWKCDALVDHTSIRMEPVRENRQQHLTGKPVEVRADGILYRGKFVEMTDTDLKLRGPTGWIILDVQKVSSIKEEGVKPVFPKPTKAIDPSFYDPEGE